VIVVRLAGTHFIRIPETARAIQYLHNVKQNVHRVERKSLTQNWSGAQSHMLLHWRHRRVGGTALSTGVQKGPDGLPTQSLELFLM
jgi:hypothetical protein